MKPCAGDGPVVHSGHDDTAGVGLGVFRMQAFLQISFQVRHFAMETLIQPGAHKRFVCRKIDISNTHALKAEISAPGSDLVG